MGDYDILVNQSAPSFEIFQAKALQDTVLDLIHRTNSVKLRATSKGSGAKTNEENEKIAIRLITDSMNLYYHLSKLAPGYFEVVNQQNCEDTLRLEIIKIGKVTGELCVTIIGCSTEALDVSIVQYESVSSKY